MSKKKPNAERPLRLDYVDPATLVENPANWRVHPPRQVAALKAALGEVGWAQALLFNERTGRIIDGHARRALAVEQGLPAVPVLVGSWSEEQERKILATLDPIGALAEVDALAVEDLLEGLEFDAPELEELARGILNDGPDAEGDADEDPRAVSFDAAAERDPGPGVARGEVVRVGPTIIACLDASSAASWPRVQQACRRERCRAAVLEPDPERCAAVVIQLEAELGRLRTVVAPAAGGGA